MIPVSEQWFRKRLQTELRRWGAKDMEKVKKLVEEVPLDVAFEIVEEEVERLSKMVVEEIHSQPFWWQPLNKEYKKSKIRKGLSEEMLKATEEYVESIGVQEASKGKKGFKIRVGVPNKKHSESDINLNDLGRIHELGTSTIPARPHWFPVYKRWRKHVPFMVQRVQRKVDAEFQARLRKLLIPESKAKKVK